MNKHEEFAAEVAANIERLGRSVDAQALSRVWMRETAPLKYSYNFRWMGRPVIQYPQDMIAMQEILWEVRPDIVVETGIAHGGSLVYYASILELIGSGSVLGIDVDIRPHNREAIEAHPMARRIRMIQGSSVDPAVVAQAREAAQGKRALVVLDSNHTHEHVLAELEAYAPLVSTGSYCVVMDTVVEDMPKSQFPDRPWGPGDNPKTAVWKYLETHQEFAIDTSIQHKLLVTVAPDGYLRRVA
jgi:cephalosporin hydroxylase